MPEFTNEHIQLFLRKRNIRQQLIRAHEKNSFADFYAKTIQVMLKMQMSDAEGKLSNDFDIVDFNCAKRISRFHRNRSESVE